MSKNDAKLSAEVEESKTVSTVEQGPTNQPDSTESDEEISTKPSRGRLGQTYSCLCIALLLINYFVAQFDKFILAYFQTPLSESLGLTATQYGLLSGYATGIVYALFAVPVAYLADTFRSARIWILSVAAVWYGLCVIFQGLSQNFTQILLARIGMGIGQSCVEPLSVSLISDLSGSVTLGWRNVFIGESVFYLGVYIGEAISGQIATAFGDNPEGWRVALRAMGITGIVVAVLLRLVVHDQKRLPGLVVDDRIYHSHSSASFLEHVRNGRRRIRTTFSYIIRMRSFWLLLLSASVRQLGGNVFGYYMPSYLGNSFPDATRLLSRYGLIAGVAGSVAVLSGGIITSYLWPRTKSTPLVLTGVGGMISSLFVFLMIFSPSLSTRPTRVLYPTMTFAYLTAELWLGALNALAAALLPPKHKTFGLALWSSTQTLLYSSGPAIVSLCLRGLDPGSAAYTSRTRVVLAVVIPASYWIAGIGFLSARPLLKRDLREGVDVSGPLARGRKMAVVGFLGTLAALVVGLVIATVVVAVREA